MIKDLLEGKTVEEKARIKGQEIAKLNHAVSFELDGFTVEILSLEAKDWGVSIYAKAWKDGKPLTLNGVETERFQISNPPWVVKDPLGDIERISTNPITNEVTVKKFREDPVQAIRECLIKMIKIVGTEVAPTPGSIGSTSTQIFPVIDGNVNDFQAPRTFASIHGDTTSNAADTTSATGWGPYILGGAGTSQFIRSIFGFDLGALGAGQTISAVTFTIDINSVADAVVDAYDYFNITAVTLATDGVIVTGDMGGFNANTTKYSTDKDLAGITLGDNAYIFSAAGIAFVQGKYDLGVDVNLSHREGHDIENVDLGGSANGCDVTYQEGSSTDPNLVIIHSVPVNSNFLLFMGNPQPQV